MAIEKCGKWSTAGVVRHQISVKLRKTASDKKMGPQINANSFSEKMWLLFDVYIYILDELDDIFFEKTSAGFQLFFLFWGC